MFLMKRICFLLIPLMFLTSIPVSANQASDLAAAITSNPANAEALFAAALASTTDVDVIVSLTQAAVTAAAGLTDSGLATQLVGKFTAAAIAVAPNTAAAEKIMQASIAAAPSFVNSIVTAVVTQSQTPTVVGAPATPSEGNVNITATVTDVIIASVQAGYITAAQATQLAQQTFGNSPAGNAITQQINNAVSGA